MTATRPAHTTLVGRFLRLEPLKHEHLPDLYEAIGHKDVFEYGYGGGLSAAPASQAEFVAWALEHMEWERGNPYAVVLIGGPHDGAVAGTTTLSDFDLRRESAHLGWTAYDPRVWSTVVNPEAKLLLLGLAFDHGFGRVKIQTDALNARSRAAIAKLGAIFEGVVRRDQPRQDGTWRDTAVFSILAEDWPDVRGRLERRIEQNAGRPVLYRSVAG
ncbi:GNAT family protein [Parafrigoribacterium mesophilum]|uniref:GNAT family N-acetyltransferase n=1 Tax=Parafrigoribacterium mesophilum TaxID=433646 RepID=UPI0031FDD2CB